MADETRDLDELARLRRRPGAKWQVPEPGVLPAWVADMDFPVAEPVLDALRRLVEDGDLGYPDWPGGHTPLREAFAARMIERFGWAPDPAQVREFTDVTQAVRAVLQVATAPGDAVAVHTPVFGPLRIAVEGTGRRLLPIPAVDTGAGWAFDLGRLDAELADRRCRVLLLVHPHNPTGRVFPPAELAALAELAERHDLLVVSDEVHADLTYAPHRHVPFAALGPEVEARTVTVTAASKAFNLAGMRCAVGHLGPERVRAALTALPAGLLGTVGIAAVRATLAAWSDGDDWLDATLRRLDRNRHRVTAVLAEQLPALGHHRPQATYLSWLDCRAVGLGPDPSTAIRRYGRLELSPGPAFDPGGTGFVRLNFATSEPVLEQILAHLVHGVREATRAAA